MFSVPDIMVVSVLALLLFGPDQLPKMMRQAGRLMREVQSTSQAFVAEMERAADVSDPIHETYRPPAPLVPSMEYAEFPAGEHSDLPPAPEHSDLPPAPEHSDLPPAPEHSDLPPAPEHSDLPPAPEHSDLPPAPEHSPRP